MDPTFLDKTLIHTRPMIIICPSFERRERQTLFKEVPLSHPSPWIFLLHLGSSFLEVNNSKIRIHDLRQKVVVGMFRIIIWHFFFVSV